MIPVTKNVIDDVIAQRTCISGIMGNLRKSFTFNIQNQQSRISTQKQIPVCIKSQGLQGYSRNLKIPFDLFLRHIIPIQTSFHSHPHASVRFVAQERIHHPPTGVIQFDLSATPCISIIAAQAFVGCYKKPVFRRFQRIYRCLLSVFQYIVFKFSVRKRHPLQSIILRAYP